MIKIRNHVSPKISSIETNQVTVLAWSLLAATSTERNRSLQKLLEETALSHRNSYLCHNKQTNYICGYSVLQSKGIYTSLEKVIQNPVTCKASCWGEDERTVERSSMLLRATSKASFVSSAVYVCTCTSSNACWEKFAATSASATERGGVNMGARLSLSRPGNRIPLDFRLCKK